MKHSLFAVLILLSSQTFAGTYATVLPDFFGFPLFVAEAQINSSSSKYGTPQLLLHCTPDGWSVMVALETSPVPPQEKAIVEYSFIGTNGVKMKGVDEWESIRVDRNGVQLNGLTHANHDTVQVARTFYTFEGFAFKGAMPDASLIAAAWDMRPYLKTYEKWLIMCDNQ